MQLPPGVTTSKPNQVCKLIKSLYGLKQVSRKWYEKLTFLLMAQGLKQANSEYSLFTKSSASFTIPLVYVDHTILARNSIFEFPHIKIILHDSFIINDLSQLEYFLSLEVAYSEKDICLCQRKYCLDLFSDSDLTTSKPASTPFDPSVNYIMIEVHNMQTFLLTKD